MNKIVFRCKKLTGPGAKQYRADNENPLRCIILRTPKHKIKPRQQVAGLTKPAVKQQVKY